MKLLLRKLAFKAGLLILVMLFFSACTDLDEELFDRITPEDFYADGENFFLSMGPAYRSMETYGSHNGLFGLQEISSDEGVIPVRGSEWFDGGRWVRLHQHDFQANDPFLRDTWQSSYRGIEVCNQYIKQFGETGRIEAQTYISELKVLRALYYYWLMDLYGNVPLYTDPDISDGIANSSREEVYQFIESEILDNLDQLSKEVGGPLYGRMNYYAAYALLVNLYLNAEVYTGTPQWGKAAAACAEIINSGHYDIENNYFDNFSIDNEGARETILAIPYDNDNFGGFNLHMVSLHAQSKETFNLRFTPWNGFCTLSEFYHSFDSSDARINSFLAGPQYDIEGNPLIDTREEEVEDPDGPNVTFTPELNELEPNCLLQAGARVGKFELKENVSISMDNDFPVFRLSDIILMRAEALWRLNPSDGEALSLVNQIRSRANMPDFQELNSENLLAERGREMVFEAKRRTDLIRFGKYGDSWDFKNNSAPCKTIFPIPSDWIRNNPLLTQNPCY